MVPEWKADVPTQELLHRMVTDPLPLSLRSGPVQQSFQRDIYFDSPDWALRRRGISCRFRIRLDDRRILTLHTAGRWEEGGGAPLAVPQTFEAEVPDLEGEQALAGTSEPARRLRAVIGPGLLLARVQFETERRSRHTRPRWLSRGCYELMYDVVTVRGHGLEQMFQEVKVRELKAGRPRLERLTAALQEQYGLRPLLVGKRDRADKALRELEAEGLAQLALGGREVAVIAVTAGSIALLTDGSSLTLPTRRGSGEAACREVLRTYFGSADGQLHLLGAVPAGLTRPPLEVWAARRVSHAHQAGVDGSLQWVPFADVLAGAGLPGLRDPRTLAALAVAARSDAFVAAMPETAASGPAADAAAGRPARLSDVALRAPVREPDRSPAPGEHFLHADLSLLEFNARVLALAEDASVPLLARLRFLAIFSANLDEFFMVRVAALKRAVAQGESGPGGSGLAPEQALQVIAIRVRGLLERQARCLSAACRPQLAAHGVRLLTWSELSAAQQESLRQYFTEHIFPSITPQAMTRAPGHPFPLIPNLRLSLAVVVRDARGGPTHFAYVKVPETVPRFVPVQEGGGFVPVEEVIRANLHVVYPGRTVEQAHPFRLTRDADLELDEHQATSLLQAIEEETKRRPYGAAVRVEVAGEMPLAVRELLLRELQFEDTALTASLGSDDVYEARGLVDLGGLRELGRLTLPALDYGPHHGGTPIEPDRSVFAVLAERDVLVHHPYDSFEATVQRFLVEAADDPDVVAIKQTLYRAGGHSAIVEALLRAAERGKEVFVFVELKARFDEERNIEWARKLAQAGIRVVWGLVELKTHAKTALVVRRESNGLRRYVHVGTGNYNAATAAIYTDLGLLSADPALGADVHDLFNELSGSSRPPQGTFRHILVSPNYLAPRLLELIAREAEHARAGRESRIRVKANGLADPEIIEALYRASQAGVDIALIVRGICTLRPGVIGLSERIRVISILGRFLEHARIFHFANGGEAEYYIGSADWRPRNLRHRVEVVTPVNDAACRGRLDDILAAELADPTAWELDQEGGYRRRTPEPGARSSQDRWLALTSASD